jgi:hypothetical protein
MVITVLKGLEELFGFTFSWARKDRRDGTDESATTAVKRNPPIGLWNFRSRIIATFV